MVAVLAGMAVVLAVKAELFHRAAPMVFADEGRDGAIAPKVSEEVSPARLESCAGDSSTEIADVAPTPTSGDELALLGPSDAAHAPPPPGANLDVQTAPVEPAATSHVAPPTASATAELHPRLIQRLFLLSIGVVVALTIAGVGLWRLRG